MSSFHRAFGKHFPIALPAEFANETALLSYIGVSADELKKIWWYRAGMYIKFEIKKRSGKVRVITAPDKRLKIIQKKISKKLDMLYRLRHPVHGFVRDRSVKTNAICHNNRKFVVNLDIKDFFPSITEKRVVGLLRSIGVPDRVAEIIARISCVAGSLPQGAPSSPVLSNMVCFRLDSRLIEFCKERHIIYTRYADDLTFSSYRPPEVMFEGSCPNSGKFDPEILNDRLKLIFSGNGFSLNPDKAHYADAHSRRVVTGVKVNSGLNVDRRYIRNIRAILHSVEKLGLPSAQLRFSSEGGGGQLPTHLRGKIAYLAFLKGQTDPVVRRLVERYNFAFPGSKISLHPTSEEERERATWVLETESTQGTAFFLDGVGLVTAAHCVSGVDEVKLFHPRDRSTIYETTVGHVDAVRDLAILEHKNIPQSEFRFLKAAPANVVTASSVVALGYPSWGPGDPLNVRSGNVTSLTPKIGIAMIEVSQQLAPGMSGGPLLNSVHEVVGIIHKGGPEESRQLAVEIQVLKEWCRELGIIE